MSTVAVSPPRTDVRRDQGPSFPTLTRLEVRKAVDTRAGFWLPLGIAGACLAVAVIAALAGDEDDHTLRQILEVVVQPAAILLPIVGILLVTSEWSQRTALQTFTLVPRRGRVVAAKVAAAVLLAVAATVLCLALSALGTAIAGASVDGVWSLPAALAGQVLLYMVVSMLIGVAFGAAFLASAPAVVLYFVLPLTWMFLVAVLGDLGGVAKWLDTSQALDPMLRHALSATGWAHAAAAVAVWMVTPLAIGLWRIRRSEIS